MPQAGGSKCPPAAPRLELGNFWQYLPPLNRPRSFTIWSQNWKISKNKKVCSPKKNEVTIILFMNCKIGYSSYRVPLDHIYETLDDIFRISKIHSRQLIIFYFSVFYQKKKKLQSQRKNFLHDKYRLFEVLSSGSRKNCLFTSSDGWDIWRNLISAK